MRSGHSFTRGFKRPFDNIFIESMQETAKYLCENVQGTIISYQQSDEISLLLIDYKSLNSQAFFDYEIQKVCSITASMATMKFNQFFRVKIDPFNFEEPKDMNDEELWAYHNSLKKALNKGAMFDSRCFNIPREEVANYFYWRQLDAIRNSIQMVGQANFSHKELQNKSCNDIQNMLFDQKNINWSEFPIYQKRGSCCIKEYYTTNDEPQRSRWSIDKNIPIFKDDGREYIERLV